MTARRSVEARRTPQSTAPAAVAAALAEARAWVERARDRRLKHPRPAIGRESTELLAGRRAVSLVAFGVLRLRAQSNPAVGISVCVSGSDILTGPTT